MNRRIFLDKLTGRVSGSFVVGTVGGLVAGIGGTTIAYKANQRPSKKSYAQYGEDLIVESICGFLGIRNPTYLDIGAAQPVQDNNTFLFYSKGSRGVLVEPNPTLCRALSSVRPGDKVLNCGIGVTNQSEAAYYMIGADDGGDWSFRNTFSKEAADSLSAKSNGRIHIQKVVNIPLININKLIAENFQSAPDFLSVDTEGFDLDILQSLDFDRHRPHVLCVETLSPDTTRVLTTILDFMKSKDYVIRGGTFVNTIFVDNRLPALQQVSV